LVNEICGQLLHHYTRGYHVMNTMYFYIFRFYKRWAN